MYRYMGLGWGGGGRVAQSYPGLVASLGGQARQGWAGVGESPVALRDAAAWAANFARLKVQHALVVKAAAAAKRPVPIPRHTGTRAKQAAVAVTRSLVPTATTMPITPTILGIAKVAKARTTARAAADRAASAKGLLGGLSPVTLAVVGALALGAFLLQGRRRAA